MSKHKYLRYRKPKGGAVKPAEVANPPSGSIGDEAGANGQASAGGSGSPARATTPASPTASRSDSLSREALGECADDPVRRRVFVEEFERLAVQRDLIYLDQRIEDSQLLIRMWRKEALLRERELDAEAINPARWQVAPGVMQRAARELDQLIERRLALLDELAAMARRRVRERIEGPETARLAEAPPQESQQQRIARLHRLKMALDARVARQATARSTDASTGPPA